ncbi:MAG: hypothetical protein LUQ25_02490 [Methanoregulaceae archaeon]|nr:hypothetical protein [Methanoregulaceae archaeon]
MNRIIAIGFSAIVVLVLLSGCTGTAPQAGQPTTGPTTGPTGIPTTIQALSTQPSPTDAVPAAYLVEVQVQKNTIATTPDIMVSYRDGVGAYLVVSMEVEVVRSDGIVEMQTVATPDQSTNVVLAGTTGTDRVIVYVTYANGATYKIYDNIAPFQSLNPY